MFNIRHYVEKMPESIAHPNGRSQISVSKSSSRGQIQRGHFANHVIENNHDINLQVQQSDACCPI